MTDKRLTCEELKAMQEVDVRTVNREALRDIRDVEINASLPKGERILDFIRQIGNPYCYRHGDYVVKISFTDTDVTLEERMLSYIRSKCCPQCMVRHAGQEAVSVLNYWHRTNQRSPCRKVPCRQS